MDVFPSYSPGLHLAPPFYWNRGFPLDSLYDAK